jgi:hypothetical protein
MVIFPVKLFFGLTGNPAPLDMQNIAGAGADF